MEGERESEREGGREKERDRRTERQTDCRRLSQLSLVVDGVNPSGQAWSTWFRVKVWGFGFEGLGFRVQGLSFRV